MQASTTALLCYGNASLHFGENCLTDAEYAYLGRRICNYRLPLSEKVRFLLIERTDADDANCRQHWNVYLGFPHGTRTKLPDDEFENHVITHGRHTQIILDWADFSDVEFARLGRCFDGNLHPYIIDEDPEIGLGD